MADKLSKGAERAQRTTDIINTLLKNANISDFNPVNIASSIGESSYVPSMSKRLASLANLSTGGGDVKTWEQQVNEGTASADVQKAYESYLKTKGRADVGGAPGKSIWERIKSTPGSALGEVAGAGMKALDILGRPGQAVTSGIKEKVHEIGQALENGLDVGDLGTAARLVNPVFLADPAIAKSMYRGLSGQYKEGFGGVLKEANVLQGKDLLSQIGRGTVGFTGDVVTDPTTWLSFGATSAGKKLTEKLLEKGLNESTAKIVTSTVKDLSRTVEKGALRKTKKLAEGDVVAATQKAIARNSRDFPKSSAAKQIFKDANEKALAGGAPADVAEKTAKEAVTHAADTLNEQLSGHISDALESYTRNRLEVRLGFLGRGKNILPEKVGESIWRPVGIASDRVAQTGVGNAIKRAFDFESHFPGLMSEIRNSALGKGLSGYNAFRREVSDVFAHTTPKMRKDIAHAIEEGTDLTGFVDNAGTSLQTLKERAQAMFKGMGNEEIAAGLRKSDELVDDGYMYHFYKTYKNRKAANEFRASRKEFFSNASTKDATGAANLSLNAAKAKGLKPEEDIAVSLLAKRAKTNRNLVRHWFNTETVKTYGELMPRTLGNAEKLGMVEVPADKLSPQLKALAKGDKVWYMPKQQYGSFDSLNKMMGVRNEDEIRGVLRAMDKANRYFKFSQTVLRPAYHMNNMVGDMTMGWFDSSSTARYLRSYQRTLSRAARMAKGMDVPDIEIAGRKMPWNRIMDAYGRYGETGSFYHTELPPGANVGVRGRLRNLPQRLRGASEARENWARHSHFLDSLDEEYNALTNNGKKLMNTAQEKATFEEAARRAGRRLEYNIDYNALTPTELNYIRRVIPFYTYVRKATPLLFQTMLTSPGKVVAIDKAKRALENSLGIEVGNSSFDRLRTPDYLAAMDGYAQLNNKPEPTILDLTRMFPNYGLVSPLGESNNPADIFKNILSRVNPLARALPEIAQGEMYFNKAKIETPTDWLLQQYDPTLAWRKGLTSDQPYAKERFAGLPIRTLGSEQQVASIKAEGNKLQAKVADLNAANREKGLEIVASRKKSGTVYKLYDRINGTQVGEYGSPAEAQKAANKFNR